VSGPSLHDHGATRGLTAPPVAAHTPVRLRPLSAPGGEHPSVCPHCWMVNPGPFRLCARCGASMESFLQESAGLRRTAAVQSPVPLSRGLSLTQRAVLAVFLLAMALAYLAQLLPARPLVSTAAPHPATDRP
jgi:hypothetical protein